MTIDGHMLLKMLEPAIRPGASSSTSGSGSVSRQGNLPLEQQSFEHLLASQLQNKQGAQGGSQVASITATAGQEATAKAGEVTRSAGHGPLGQLARFDQVENNSLRSLMSSHVQSQTEQSEQTLD